MREAINSSYLNLLRLLQLTNSALPIGAYSYSEGLETLVELGKIKDKQTLEHWLNQELYYGAIRLEAAVMARAFNSVMQGNWERLSYWNKWLSAARETEELRNQSWQMGYSLMRLIQEIQPETIPIVTACGNPCNYAIAFGLISAYWEIDLLAATLGYLHSWASNLVNAGVKIIPLGQTAGQQIMLNLHSSITHAAQEILNLDDDNLNSCGWGLALASMAHETQYTRLFRS
ncbi:Urease accessory protein ureF [Crinalium epipsammum PCC 9333]|uniref:Urease accessory protein UreF n=1 Tax=Crinalium epipsammum PCC 9333 TaxID=1173022 RepID=K9VZ40_9CYAN|nr:urease accessory protein UreF [Crinalium epipsammum]AFZ13398.1 Urease accessory protein ureF [Crinalium epipsammum PCC 9333]